MALHHSHLQNSEILNHFFLHNESEYVSWCQYNGKKYRVNEHIISWRFVWHKMDHGKTENEYSELIMICLSSDIWGIYKIIEKFGTPTNPNRRVVPLL